jgi:hypothetical protein
MQALANTLWFLSCLPQGMAWRRSASRVARTQEQLLLRLLRCNALTEYGQRYGFCTIRTIAEYQARVPLTAYEDYAPSLAAISAGRANVLTREPVLLLEPTSGSTAATKLIPYTVALKREFQRAVAAWLGDLYWHEPRLLRGPAYWSISPVTQRATFTEGGIPIGFADDSEYLSGWQRRLAQAVLAVPAAVRLIEDIESFRYVTLLFLLRSRALALISVWNPTFLTLLAARLREWEPVLIADLAQGTLTPPRPLPAEVFNQLIACWRVDARRAREVRAAFVGSATPAELHTRLWPRLRVVSCWADAQAAPYADELARLFPQARVQGKGLLATEAVVSFPLWRQTGAALAYQSHFFEFIPATESGEMQANETPRLAHVLEPGRHYTVAVTTGGGLYRYQLHDLVEVTGHIGACPLLRFRGKTALVSDWFGEKLNEQHVTRALSHLFATPPVFAMLACETGLTPPAYVLFVETAIGSLTGLAVRLEAALCENFHYRYCRQLGQLGAVRVFHLEGDAQAAYQAHCVSLGQRLGDIKPVTLQRGTGWLRVFRGRLVD